MADVPEDFHKLLATENVVQLLARVEVAVSGDLAVAAFRAPSRRSRTATRTLLPLRQSPGRAWLLAQARNYRAPSGVS